MYGVGRSGTQVLRSHIFKEVAKSVGRGGMERLTKAPVELMQNPVVMQNQVRPYSTKGGKNAKKLNKELTNLKNQMSKHQSKLDKTKNENEKNLELLKVAHEERARSEKVTDELSKVIFNFQAELEALKGQLSAAEKPKVEKDSSFFKDYIEEAKKSLKGEMPFSGKKGYQVTSKAIKWLIAAGVSATGLGILSNNKNELVQAFKNCLKYRIHDGMDLVFDSNAEENKIKPIKDHSKRLTSAFIKIENAQNHLRQSTLTGDKLESEARRLLEALEGEFTGTTVERLNTFPKGETAVESLRNLEVFCDDEITRQEQFITKAEALMTEKGEVLDAMISFEEGVWDCFKQGAEGKTPDDIESIIRQGAQEIDKRGVAELAKHYNKISKNYESRMDSLLSAFEESLWVKPIIKKE